MILEIEPGHFIDLSQVYEADDDATRGELFLLLPAPALADTGPHGVVVTGESRALVLAYFRRRARIAREALTEMVTAEQQACKTA